MNRYSDSSTFSVPRMSCILSETFELSCSRLLEDATECRRRSSETTGSVETDGEDIGSVDADSAVLSEVDTITLDVD